MNKKLLSIALFSILCNINFAQNKEQLLTKFKLEKQQNEAIFNRKQSKKSKLNKNEEISSIAAATDEFIVYNKLLDNRANIASNIEDLQNGQIGNFYLNGQNMEITIFDGGAPLTTHVEFSDKENSGKSRVSDLENGAESISNHSTAVSGFIAAEGVNTITQTDNVTGTVTATFPNGAKGVLPNARVTTAGFKTVNDLTIFEKLLNFDKYISNHSYGTNLGWELIEDNTNALGYALKYNLSTTSFTSPQQSAYGAYYSNDYNYDAIGYNFPKYTIVKSAGNEYGDGPNSYARYNFNLYKSDDTKFTDGDLIPEDNCQSGAYCISFGSLAKNIIVVGSVDIPTSSNFKFTSPSQIIHSSYSSAGPRKDGAIKPDLVAVGTRVISPTSSSNNAYDIGSGTSYSAPKVTGVVGAITQLKRLLTGDNTYYFNSDEVRAILLHTTEEAGEFDGPDNKFGWGLLDGKKAAEVVLAAHNKEIIFERNEKISGINQEKLISSKVGEELKATITWIDPPTSNYKKTITGLINDTSSKLINDLDIRLIDTETNDEYLPWKLDLSNVTGAAIKGDNTVDNIEQILIKTPISGRKYKVIISNKNTLVDNNGTSSNQIYTLLITGAQEDKSTIVSKNVLTIYPTLAKDVVNIKTEDKIEKVQLIDISGKLISTTNSEKINVSSLSSGVYIIKIKTDKEVITKKIIKQ